MPFPAMPAQNRTNPPQPADPAGQRAKPEITEREAATRCVHEVTAEVQSSWHLLLRDLVMLPCQPRFPDHAAAPGEFALAVFAIQVQGIDNMMPAAQAQRVRIYLRALLGGPPFGESGIARFDAYDLAWKQTLGRGEIPTLGPSQLLYDALGYAAYNQSGFRDPRLVVALANLLVRYGSLYWWKDLLAAWKVVPETEK